MRITCNQCGRDISSDMCAKYCDFDKRQKQFDEVQEIADKFMQALEQKKKNKEDLKLLTKERR